MSTADRMHIAVVGSGAVGGYFGARLAASGQHVTFVARGAHLKAIRERGLAVWSHALGDFVVQCDAQSDTTAIGPVDVVMFTVKTYDNATALPLLPPLMGPDTAVLTLQNGVDSADEIAAVVGEAHVLGGTTYVATGIRAPGLIEQTGTHRSINFGEMFGTRLAVSPRVERLGRVLAAADIEVSTHPDARVPIWEKFAYLCPFSGFTGAARVPSGPIWSDPVIRAQFLACKAEVEAVARAEGVTFSHDFEEKFQHYMNTLPPTVRSSLLIDLSIGKRIEVEALQGALVRRARAHGIPTPVTSTLYAVLRPHAGGAPI